MREKTGVQDEGSLWIRKSIAAILLGGAGAAVVAFFVQKKDLALGLFLGSLLSILYFHSLHAISGKILRAGDRGRKVFWVWTILRWVIIALVGWGLILISPSCLLGALGGYLWALAVLGWKGWRAIASSKPSTRPLEKG